MLAAGGELLGPSAAATALAPACTSAPSTVPAAAAADPQSVRAKAQRVAVQFEEIFTRQMMEAFRKSAVDSEGGGIFGKGTGSSTYENWFDEHMAHHMSARGRIGIADTLMRYFDRLNYFGDSEQAKGGQKPQGGMINAVA